MFWGTGSLISHMTWPFLKLDLPWEPTSFYRDQKNEFLPMQTLAPEAWNQPRRHRGICQWLRGWKDYSGSHRMLSFLESLWRNVLHLLKSKLWSTCVSDLLREKCNRATKNNPREIGFANHFLSFSVIADTAKVDPKFMRLCVGYQMGDLRLVCS